METSVAKIPSERFLLQLTLNNMGLNCVGTLVHGFFFSIVNTTVLYDSRLVKLRTKWMQTHGCRATSDTDEPYM